MRASPDACRRFGIQCDDVISFDPQEVLPHFNRSVRSRVDLIVATAMLIPRAFRQSADWQIALGCIDFIPAACSRLVDSVFSSVPLSFRRYWR